MLAEPRKRRLLRFLRHAAKAPRTGGERPTTDDTALWSAHERALVRARDAGAAAQRIASTAARQRTAMDDVADRTRALASRTSELQASATRAFDAFERLGLVALNAGLEAARFGENEGRPLALVSEEVRSQSSRGSDAARDLGSILGHLTRDLEQLQTQVGQAHAVLTEVTQDSARAAGASSDAEVALLDLGERVKRVTGSDPEAVRAVAETGERVRSLVTSLAALNGKVPRELLVSTLDPVLEPLARLLGGDGFDEPNDGTDR